MKKLLTIFIAACLLLQSGFVFAAATPAVEGSMNPTNLCVTIEGTNFTPGTSVSVLIGPDGFTYEFLLAHNLFAYSDIVIVREDKSFTVNTGLRNGALGTDYVVYVGSEMDGHLQSQPFSYQSANDFGGVLQAFNNADENSIQSVLETNAVDALLDMTEYNALTAPGAKAKVASLLFAERGTEFADIMAIHNAFRKAILVGAMPYVADPAGLLAKYGDSLGQGVTDNFFACNDAEEAKAGEFLQNQTLADANALIAALPESIFVGKVNAATTGAALQQIFMIDYASQLTLDKTNYNKVTNKANVFANLLALPAPIVTGFTDAESSFKTAAEDAYKAQQGGGGGGLGGAGGGGGAAPGAYPPAAGDQDVQKEQYYTDLASVPWAVDHINYLTRYGVLSGDGSGSFRPNDTVTRAEFVKMIVTAFKLASTGSSTGFGDVKANDWYAPYVATGVANGLVKGISDTYFGANDKITRQDLAVLCYRASQNASMILGKTNLNTPTDLAVVADYAKAAVESFYAAGVINGDETGAFNPARNATRAEAAKIVSGLLSLKGGY